MYLHDGCSECLWTGVSDERAELQKHSAPLAFFREINEANMNIGPLRIVPGSARIDQASRRQTRYVNKLNVFQLAFWARGTLCGHS